MSLFYRGKEERLENNMSKNHCGSFKMIYWVPNLVGTATDGDRWCRPSWSAHHTNEHVK